MKPNTETTGRNPQKDNFNAKNDNFIETGQMLWIEVCCSATY
ncbi:hypothetical protein MHPYR_550036 [uncultured Mycobacterium sp.]|uniref:Uncharacterized protein n=1 Tax=uncultured Mycobacterium sp. TaxID=171292 RepID=A0A1Y5PHX8_9MYCO|nr:hypothetical protein MHPYR_550036 [uncultured Mycobacterium sp.]